MDLSLVVCTRNRCRQLARCLEAIGCIVFARPWELIVVDNGSSDETAAALREFAASACFPVRYVFEPKPGLGNARNAGVAMAGGAIVAFTDDDCYPAPDFLARIWSSFADESVGYIPGRILLHDPTDEPMTIRLSTTPLTFAAKSFINAGAISGANIAFRRSVLDKIGGF